MPRLSVLMSVFGAEQTVRLAIGSTLRSMPRDSELVVAVDGAGQGPTEQAIDRVNDRRLRVTVSKQNLGLAGQLQRLMEMTDSEYVGRMDADDVSLPWRFAVTMPRLASVDYVFTAGIRFGRRRLSTSYPLSLNHIELARALLFFTPVFHSSLVARRAAMDAAGGYRQLRYGEDSEFWVRAAARGQRLIKLGAPCIAYRLSPSQMSSAAGAARRLDEDPIMVESFTSLARTLGLPMPEVRDVARMRVPQAELEALLSPCRRPQRRYLRRQIRASTRLIDS